MIYIQRLYRISIIHEINIMKEKYEWFCLNLNVYTLIISLYIFIS